MKKIFLLSIIVSFIAALAACKKDSIGTKPQLTFNSYSLNEVIENNSNLDISFQVQDSDGDIENQFWIQTFFDSRTDTFNFEPRQMPNLGSHKGGKLDAEVILHLESINLSSGTTTIPDSVHFRVYIEDNAGNKSDTISTPKLAIIKQ